jgi:hypothetical protein
MRVVVIESPYRCYTAWELERNLAYARALVEHVTLRGDSPVASHLLITQSLDDRDPKQREAGICAGLALLRVADVHAFGIDLGVSDGMRRGMKDTPGRVQVEQISLPEWAEAMACNSQTKLQALVAKYGPKWHAHEQASIG